MDDIGGGGNVIVYKLGLIRTICHDASDSRGSKENIIGLFSFKEYFRVFLPPQVELLFRSNNEISVTGFLKLSQECRPDKSLVARNVNSW
jgi:hypothetical protein